MGSIRSSDVVRLLASWILSFLALLLTAAILPGFSHDSWTPLLVAAAVTEATGRKPALSTTGGTSDARFITHHCPVVEFGLVGQTMHQINERVPVADLQKLTGIYRKIIDRYFA